MVIVITAHLIAYSMFGTIGPSYLIAFLMFLSVIGMVGGIVWRLIDYQRANHAAGHMEQAISEIKGLNIEEAKKLASQLLEDTTKFKLIQASIDLQVQYQLPASLQEFFSAYESIEAIAGEARLSRNLIGPSEYQKGFLRIGTNSDFTEIAVRPREDYIYEVDGSERNEADFAVSRLPSIYHWVLVTAKVLYGSDIL